MRVLIVPGFLLSILVLPGTALAQDNAIRKCRQQASVATNTPMGSVEARRDADLPAGNFTVLWEARRPNGRVLSGVCEAARNGRIVRFESNRQPGGGDPGSGGTGGGNARPPGNVQYTGMIMNRATNKCVDLDTSGGVQGNNQTNVHQYGCHGGDNQTWELVNLGNNEYAIRNVMSGLVLDVEGLSKDDGANVYQFGWLGGANQKWRTEGNSDNFQLVSVNSNKCLTVRGGSREDGANLVQRSCTGRPNQRWHVGRQAR